jgi:acetyl esterase
MLDPFIQALFNRMPQLAEYALWEKSPAEARTAFTLLAKFSEPQSVPIGRSQDVEAAGGAGPVMARLYTPVAAGSGALPGIVFFHGGGFVLGDLESYDPFCRTLANESSCRVLSVDYRLAPEHPFPAAVDDAVAVMGWVEENAGALGIDPNRLSVAGDSAGGNLAAVVCQQAKAAGRPAIGCQLLIYPATVMGRVPDKESATGVIQDARNFAWFKDNYLPAGTDPRDPRVSPLYAADLSGLPAAYIVTAGYDLLRSDGIAYAEKLKAAGVAVTHVDYPSMIHGFLLMRNWIPAAPEALAAAAQAVKAVLGQM